MSQELRAALTEDLAKQTEHPCWAKVVVLWDRPYDEGAVWVYLAKPGESRGVLEQ